MALCSVCDSDAERGIALKYTLGKEHIHQLCRDCWYPASYYLVKTMSEKPHDAAREITVMAAGKELAYPTLDTLAYDIMSLGDVENMRFQKPREFYRKWAERVI
jgi:hypothetical protein